MTTAKAKATKAKNTQAAQAEEVTTSVARDRFADIIERAFFQKERVVIVRRGKKAAAIIPIEDLEALEAFEAAKKESAK